MLKISRNNFEWGGGGGVTILSHRPRPVTSRDLKQDRLFFRESVSTFLQLVVAGFGNNNIRGLGAKAGFKRQKYEK